MQTGNPLGWILHGFYLLCDNFGVAILLFAVFVRIVLFPVSVVAHKNSLRLLKLKPALDLLKIRYSADKEQMSEEQYKLFKKEKYNPLLGLLPLILQLIVVIGMLRAMYSSIAQMAGDELLFLGMDLGEIPRITSLSSLWIIPILSGITALLFCYFQTILSPGALSQGKVANLSLSIFTIAFSLYFAFVTPAGVGIYWIVGNILGIAVLFILNAMYNPRILAAEALQHIASMRQTPMEKKTAHTRRKALAEREKADTARFMAADKRLVLYAISGGQYKYYKAVVDYLLAHSHIIIHYLTNDPDDGVFHLDNDRILTYYIGQKKTMALMLKLETEILLTTVQGLSTYHFKRSMAKSDIEYIYIEHGPASTHLTAREAAYDHFDTIFCTGPHHAAEMRRREEMAGLKKKRLVKIGYGLHDQLTASYVDFARSAGEGQNETPQILIAPSWQTDNIMELCLEKMLDVLLGKGFRVVVRPHPQYVRMFMRQIEELCGRHEDATSKGELSFETDFSGNDSIFKSDIVITDWSGIAFEFSYATLKPCVFINTPMKVMNPNWENFCLPVLDISLRDKLGIALELSELGKLDEVVAQCLAAKDGYRDDIRQIVSEYLYNPGRSGEAGARYIMGRLGV